MLWERLDIKKNNGKEEKNMQSNSCYMLVENSESKPEI